MVRGDLIHDRGARQRTVFETEEPITGIEFKEGNITTLYIATTGRISTLVISGRGQGQPARTLEEAGCAVDCMSVDKVSRDVVVARDDGIYYYGLHGRGPAYAYESPKKAITVHKDYIAVISPSQTNSVSQASLRAFGTSTTDHIFNTSTFTVLHTDLKFIAHQETLSEQVKAIFKEWGDLFILTLEGHVSKRGPDIIKHELTYLRSSDITRKLSSRSWNCCTNVTCTYWPSIWRKNLAWILPNRTSSTGSMAISFTRSKTTIQPCSST